MFYIKVCYNKIGILLVLSMIGFSLGACSTTSAVSSRIQFSSIVAPPSGLLAFCADARTKCKRALAQERKSDFVFTGGHGGRPLSKMEGIPADRITISHAQLPENTGLTVRKRVTQAKISRVEVSAERMSDIIRVNQKINNRMIWQSDMDRYGLEERWVMPLSFGLGNYGDCEDFALEKRRLLLEIGIPAAALALATTYSAATGSHALLIVRTTQGDYALDSASPWVLPWAETEYQWVNIQAGESLLQWRTIVSRTTLRANS